MQNIILYYKPNGYMEWWMVWSSK